jgi:sigma-E factor negative regulatory protein RseA
MEQMQTQELISALVDGQLQGEAFAQGVELTTADAQARDTWATYHLIGDVLRSGENAVGSAPAAFVVRLQQRLVNERPVGSPLPGAEAVARQRPEAANDGSFRWKVLAGFASVAAVGAIAWSVVATLPAKPDGAQLAQRGNGTVLTSGARGVMIRDPQLDELLAAHRQLGGASALQMSAGFVRNATFESTGR